MTIGLDAEGLLGCVADVQALDTALNKLKTQGWDLVLALDADMMKHGTTTEAVAALKPRRH